MFDELHDEACSTGAALVPSCAFEYALGDAAAELSADGLEPCDEVEIAYAVKGFGTSRGTRKSIMTALASQGFHYRNNALVPLLSPPFSRRVNFPKFGRLAASSVPFGEPILVPRHVTTQNVTTLMVLPLPAAILSPAISLAGLVLRSPLAGPLIAEPVEEASVRPPRNGKDQSSKSCPLPAEAAIIERLLSLVVTPTG